MDALKVIIPLYLILLIFYGNKNIKGFLLLTGIVTLPFRTTYSLIYSGFRSGWTNGIMISLSDISFLLLFFYLICQKRKLVRISSKIDFIILFFIGACSLSVVNSSASMLTGYQIIMVTQIAFLYYFVLTNSIESEKDLNLVIVSIMVSLFFQGAMSTIQYFTGHAIDLFSTGRELETFITTIGEESGHLRAFGTVGKPNAFAGYIVSLLILNIPLLFGMAQYKKIRLLAVLFGFLALIFSFSRGGWLSFGIVIVMYFLQNRHFIKPHKLIPILLVGIITVGVFYPVIESRIFGEDHNAAMSRIPLIKIALNMITTHPIIGIGANTFRDDIRSYVPTDLNNIYLDQVHNQYLLVFAETGVIGLFCFLWFLKVLFQKCKTCILQDKNRLIYLVGIGIRFSLVAASIHMLVDIYNSYLLLSNLFILASILTASENILRSDKSKAVEENIHKKLATTLLTS